MKNVIETLQEKYNNVARNDKAKLAKFLKRRRMELGYTLEEVSLDLHTDDMPEITTEYEDKFSKDGMPIYYVMCNKDVKR